MYTTDISPREETLDKRVQKKGVGGKRNGRGCSIRKKLQDVPKIASFLKPTFVHRSKKKLLV